MFRPASRVLLRTPAVAVRGSASKRLISTGSSTETKSRSFKNTVVRLGLAAGAVYYYNTSSVFTENPSLSFRSTPKSTPEDDAPLPTLDSIKPKIRETRAPALTPADPDAQPISSEASLGGKTPQELEEEAGQEAAFNPETGEINWDCPCLGGMAHGPCGEEFKAAFSCFVYSEEEPKGIDCIEKFKGMQDCFRQYPEVYGAELEDDEDAAATTTAAVEAAADTGAEAPAAETPSVEEKRAIAKEVNAQVKSDAAKEGELSEADLLVPKAHHEAESDGKPETEK